MRAYIRNYHYEGCYHPEDVRKIVEYLEANGDLYVSAQTVEVLYKRFLNGLGWGDWVTPSDDILDEFANWLNYYDL